MGGCQGSRMAKDQKYNLQQKNKSKFQGELPHKNIRDNNTSAEKSSMEKINHTKDTTENNSHEIAASLNEGKTPNDMEVESESKTKIYTWRQNNKRCLIVSDQEDIDNLFNGQEGQNQQKQEGEEIDDLRRNQRLQLANQADELENKVSSQYDSHGNLKAIGQVDSALQKGSSYHRRGRSSFSMKTPKSASETIDLQVKIKCRWGRYTLNNQKITQQQSYQKVQQYMSQKKTIKQATITEQIHIDILYDEENEKYSQTSPKTNFKKSLQICF